MVDVLSIWFNRTYASHAHVLAMLRDNPDRAEVRLIASHVDPDSPVLGASDEAYAEPDPTLTEADYVAWALEFCAERAVDVFFPRLHLAVIADARDQFARIGVRVAAPPAAAVRLFDDKAATYAAAARLGLLVPPHRVVTDAPGLLDAVADLADSGSQLCLKPVSGVGGEGFRTLITGRLTLADLLGPVTAAETVDRVCAALDDAAAAGRPAPPLLVAPVMPGPEVSVDTLADPQGCVVAAVGRVKTRRRRSIVDDVEARKAAETLVQAHGLAYLSNTQVRYWQAPADAAPRPYLLEVNPRMSGGLYQTRQAGVNLPWAAVRLVTGQPADLPAPRFDVAYALMDTVVPL